MRDGALQRARLVEGHDRQRYRPSLADSIGPSNQLSIVIDASPYGVSVIPWADGPGIVELPDGRRIRGRGLRRRLPQGQDPEFAVYLLGRDPGPFDWEHRWVCWPDFRSPASTHDAISALQEAYERSATERVEVACGGGVGRTGTALAGIAVLAGVPCSEAVAWVRREYHARAAETPGQRRWVLRLGGAR